MGLILLKCSNCGAELEVNDDRKLFFCSYCGAKMMLETQEVNIEGMPTTDSLLKRAKRFEEEENYEKAREYYNRVLDIDPDNEDARAGLRKKYQLIFVRQKQTPNIGTKLEIMVTDPEGHTESQMNYNKRKYKNVFEVLPGWQHVSLARTVLGTRWGVVTEFYVEVKKDICIRVRYGTALTGIPNARPLTEGVTLHRSKVK